MCSEQGAESRTPLSKEQRGGGRVQQRKVSRGARQVEGGPAEHTCQMLLRCPKKQGSRSVWESALRSAAVGREPFCRVLKGKWKGRKCH